MNNFNTALKRGEVFCHACLSVDRKLYPLGDYIDVYARICCDFFTANKQMVYLICWECVAVLRKAKQFEEKVLNSQRILQYYYRNPKNGLPVSLSNLKIVKTDTENIIETKYDEEWDSKTQIQNIKEEINTTLENHDSNECIDAQTDDFENTPVQDDIKKETPIELNEKHCDSNVKKRNPKKAKMYKYVFDKISYSDIERLTKKIPIQLSEIKYWLERERDSAAFKSAKFKCQSCACFWKKEATLLEHRRKYHDVSSGHYSCDVCNCRFPKKSQLCRHLPRHSLRECGTCRHKGLRRHIGRHLAEHTRKIQCAECGSTAFSNIRQLYRHHKALHQVFVCDHCAKRCRSKHMMEKHMSRHTSTYECKPCARNYKTLASYRKHRSLRHGRAGEAAYCAPCGRQYASAPLYRRHVAASKAHSAERTASRLESKIPCPACGRVYSRKAYMMNHYRHVHMNQSKYICQQCDRHFLNRTRYVDHMRYKHEGVKKEKNKLCNICGRGFAANRTLMNHIRTHSGERPFPCAQCGASFTQKHAMLAHARHVHDKRGRGQV